MKIVILANDDIPYSGLLSYPILKKFANEISGIFIQDRILDSNTTTLGLFNKVKKKSSLQFAIFYAREIINYKIAVLIRRIFHMNKHSNDCYIETNANLGKMFGIPVFKIEGSINDEIWLNKINKIKPDLIICIRYAEILKNSLLTIPNGGVINFHPSLLPKYKGIGTHKRILKNNDKYTGCTVHLVTSKLDSGPVILKKKVLINKNDNEKTLSYKVLKQEHLAYSHAIRLICK